MTEPNEPEWTWEQLHRAFDLLLAQYLLDNPSSMPSRTSALDVMHWSWERIVRARGEVGS